jgi:Tfp pilus assembly PilM family ATPase
MRKRIVDELGIQPAVAERYKRLYGIRAEDTGYRPMLAKAGAMDESRMASILLGVLSPIVHHLADDIEKSFRYGLELYPDLPINCLVLAGGGSSLDGLVEVLAKRLGLRVRRLTAESSTSLNAKHPMLADNVLAGMANCIGLSFGAIQS